MEKRSSITQKRLFRRSCWLGISLVAGFLGSVACAQADCLSDIQEKPYQQTTSCLTSADRDAAVLVANIIPSDETGYGIALNSHSRQGSASATFRGTHDLIITDGEDTGIFFRTSAAPDFAWNGMIGIKMSW